MDRLIAQSSPGRCSARLQPIDAVGMRQRVAQLFRRAACSFRGAVAHFDLQSNNLSFEKHKDYATLTGAFAAGYPPNIWYRETCDVATRLQGHRQAPAILREFMHPGVLHVRHQLFARPERTNPARSARSRTRSLVGGVADFHLQIE